MNLKIKKVAIRYKEPFLGSFKPGDVLKVKWNEGVEHLLTVGQLVRFHCYTEDGSGVIVFLRSSHVYPVSIGFFPHRFELQKTYKERNET